MFSLLVTVLSIALVALLALATLYYVSDIFSDRSLKANAATVRLQGQQIAAAFDMYRANHGTWPQTLQDLIDGDYLKREPQPPGTVSAAPSALGLVLPSAVANTLRWEMPRAGRPHFWVLESIGQVACQVLNIHGRQSTSVLEKVDARHLDQCFGRSAPFTYLWTLDGSTLDADIPWNDTTGGGASYGGPGFGRPIAFPSPVLIPGEPNPTVVVPNPGLARGINLLDGWKDPPGEGNPPVSDPPPPPPPPPLSAPPTAGELAIIAQETGTLPAGMTLPGMSWNGSKWMRPDPTPEIGYRHDRHTYTPCTPWEGRCTRAQIEAELAGSYTTVQGYRNFAVTGWGGEYTLNGTTYWQVFITFGLTWEPPQYSYNSFTSAQSRPTGFPSPDVEVTLAELTAAIAAAM